MPDLLRDVDYRDVEAMMRSANYWPTDNKPLRQALAREQAQTGAVAAKAEFERLTGWDPFFTAADAPMTTREFDWNGSPVTQLDGGVLELGAIRVNGQLIPENAQRLLPRNAVSKGRCFHTIAWQPRYMQFYRTRPKAFGPHLVEVTARWGYCTQYPGDVWQQILQAAGLITLTQIENFQSLASLSEQGFAKSWDVVGIITQKDTAERWRKEFPATIKRYVRNYLP